MDYLSVCSGIEAATVAWQPLGWNAVGFSEIEPFPSAVLTHHWPTVANLGDMNDFKRWPVSGFDVLVGGTPCQSFSVAGLRAGMDDPRGNLALTFCAILSRYRPVWFVWENVPGVLSANDGRDFGALIGAMVKLGYGIAYRVLDAQYFGVPQRRRRVFVVGYLGDWRRSAEVLFNPESLRGNPAPSREARKETAGEPRDGIAQDCRQLNPDIVNQAISAKWHKGSSGPAGDEHHNLVVTAFSCKDYGNDARDDTAPTLRAMNHDKSHINDGGQVAVAFTQNQREEVRTLDVAGAFPAIRRGDHKNETVLKYGTDVRRLTPLECERLQGFPDNYTNIPGASDTARYKAIGNSMAVPVMAWIGRRIHASQLERS